MTLLHDPVVEPELVDIVLSLRKRVEQLEHDIAAVKRIAHEHGQFGDIEHPFARRL